MLAQKSPRHFVVRPYGSYKCDCAWECTPGEAQEFGEEITRIGYSQRQKDNKVPEAIEHLGHVGPFLGRKKFQLLTQMSVWHGTKGFAH